VRTIKSYDGLMLFLKAWLVGWGCFGGDVLGVVSVCELAERGAFKEKRDGRLEQERFG
jgi:hypothetical protein